jgi:hypothetical protein
MHFFYLYVLRADLRKQEYFQFTYIFEILLFVNYTIAYIILLTILSILYYRLYYSIILLYFN